MSPLVIPISFSILVSKLERICFDLLESIHAFGTERRLFRNTKRRRSVWRSIEADTDAVKGRNIRNRAREMYMKITRVSLSACDHPISVKRPAFRSL
jgi:hypothetical protein